MPRRLILLVVLALGAWSPPALAQDADHGDESIDQAVARALLDRGKALYAAGDHTNAKMLFIESLERSAEGAWSKEALAMLRASNEKLGVANLEHGNPSATSVGGDSGPLDPYATDGGGEGPLDPYGGGDPVGDPEDPYAGLGGERPGNLDDEPDDGSVARRRVAMWGGGFGALLGLALVGPNDDNNQTRGAAVLVAALTGAAGGVGGYYLLGRKPLAIGQGQAIISAGSWGVYTVALFGDAVTGVDTTTTNEGFKAAAIGGAVGLGGGVLYAVRAEPTEADVSLTNSFGLYGTTTGLMLGVVMNPPESEAYSINGALGAVGGLGIGYWLSTRYEVSRRRMIRVDLGALAGLAASWALFYPLIADDTTSGDEQAAGAVSIGAMAVGGYLGWRLGRGLEDAGADDASVAGLPGLVTRSDAGAWSVGTPLPRPMENPALAPRTGGFSMGIDLAAGRF